eukprot:GHVL01044294.1.p1 GENE.GHVL01044294.1~~GHVL01044294.1.p1  ORF type:complete len:261 (-),score=49.52 GHVL01044294.1:603-1385(-)
MSESFDEMTLDTRSEMMRLIGLCYLSQQSEELKQKIDEAAVKMTEDDMKRSEESLSDVKAFLNRKKIRIYADGIFDLTHSGHFNALRQAKALGDELVVGVVSDSEAKKTKGVPIYPQSERAELIKSCKWVDEVVVGTPYEVTCELLDSLNCDFAAHGDDFAPTSEGKDCYDEPRKAGRLKIFKRTEGVSTTTLVSRLLLASKNMDTHLCDEPQPLFNYVTSLLERRHVASEQTLMTSKRLLQFINKRKRKLSNDDKIGKK